MLPLPPSVLLTTPGPGGTGVRGVGRGSDVPAGPLSGESPPAGAGDFGAPSVTGTASALFGA